MATSLATLAWLRDPAYAAKVLWLDAFVANVDRSWRNPNLLVWHGDVWVIDHGAALYFHHAWAGGITDPGRFAEQAWSVDDHIFKAYAENRVYDVQIAQAAGSYTGQYLRQAL